VVSTTYLIRLEENDLGQILDGLHARAEAWEKTADYHRTGVSPCNYVIEESNDANEAERIAAHYRAIIGKIEEQRQAQP